jgi:hypothetical protein
MVFVLLRTLPEWRSLWGGERVLFRYAAHLSSARRG